MTALQIDPLDPFDTAAYDAFYDVYLAAVPLGDVVHVVPGVERGGVVGVELDDPQVAHRARCTRPSSQTASSDS